MTYDDVMKAVDKFYYDQSRTKQETLDGLETVKEELETMIETLEGEIEEEEGRPLP